MFILQVIDTSRTPGVLRYSTANAGDPVVADWLALPEAAKAPRRTGRPRIAYAVWEIDSKGQKLTVEPKAVHSAMEAASIVGVSEISFRRHTQLLRQSPLPEDGSCREKRYGRHVVSFLHEWEEYLKITSNVG